MEGDRMIEYEYSFKVESLEPYIKYCEEQGYEKVSFESQVRELFTSTNNILARITTKNTSGVVKTFLDFKDDDDSDEILKCSRETIPLEVTAENRKSINSILDILNYKKIKHLDRKRVIYKKGNVLFEIDNYFSPEVMYVVAIEGEKEAVDKVYKDISKRVNE